MRRREREVKSIAEKIAILEKCKTIRIAMVDAETGLPYVVPLSFGYEATDADVRVYFHSAGAGRKVELMRDGMQVFFEADSFDCVQPTSGGITTRFASLMAPGHLSLMESDEEKIHGLQLICEHYGYGDYPIGRCKGLKPVKVICLTIKAEELTGKLNPRQPEVAYR